MNINTYYRKYLTGADLPQASLVTIAAFTEVEVTPNPRKPAMKKLCLVITGLPADLPNQVLLGKEQCDNLADITGERYTEKMVGKTVEIYATSMRVGNQDRQALRFRKPTTLPAVNKPAPAAAARPSPLPTGGPTQRTPNKVEAPTPPPSDEDIPF